MSQTISYSDNTIQISKKVINLYKVDPMFYPLMPDTSMTFNSALARKTYYFNTQKKFSDFKAGLTGLKEKDAIEITLMKQQADIMFDDYMQFINYKFVEQSEKTTSNINLLALYSPYSNLTPLQKIKDIFQSFPPEIRKSEQCEKLARRLDAYSFDKNIGYNIGNKADVILTDTLMNEITFKSLTSKLKQYNIISFGASWCLPCRLEGLQLKEWLPFIDTSTVGIIGLSVDGDLGKWKKFLNEDELPWEEYLIKNGMENGLVKDLKFTAIPDNFLIDAAGNVLFENTDIRKILLQIPVLHANASYTK